MKKKFFLRRFRHYLLLFIAPVLVSMYAILLIYSRTVLDTIHNESASSVQLSSQTIDTLVSDTVYQHDLLTSNPQLALALKKILSNGSTNYENYIFINTMTGLIRGVTNAHPYVLSTYLELDDYPRFYSSVNGINSTSDYYDLDWKNCLPFVEQNQQYAVKRSIHTDSFASTTPVVTFFRKMTTLHGTIIVNMRYDDFISRLDTITQAPDEALFVMNKKGEFIASSSSASEISNSELASLRDIVLPAPDYTITSQFFSLNGRHFWISSTSSDFSDLVYISMIPSRALISLMSGTLVIYALITCFAVVFILFTSYTITKSSFNHIEEIIDIFSDAEHGIYPTPRNTPIKDEYDVILYNVIQLFINTTFLNSQLKSQYYEKQAAELQALQMQINPHFLSNTLQTLDFEVREMSGGQTVNANRIIASLSDILRYSIQPVTSMVTFSEELNILKKYIAIQKYRFGNGLIFYSEIGPEAESVKVPRLILQPILENSISHGILPSGHSGVIKLRAYVRDGLLKIAIIDSGIGMSKEEISALYEKINNPQSRNIGLTNVNRRLILTYGPQYAIHILSKKNICTCIKFSIPANYTPSQVSSMSASSMEFKTI